MSDLPELTLILGPHTVTSLALNAHIRENRAYFSSIGITALASRAASPILRRASDARPDSERIADFEEATKNRPAILSAVNFFGPPQAALLNQEMFPDAETKLAGLGGVIRKARIIVAADSLAPFFMTANNDLLEARVRNAGWEALYELSWADLVREVSEAIPEADILVVTARGAGRVADSFLDRIFGEEARQAPARYAFFRHLITETGHAVLDRLLTSNAPSEDMLAEIYASFSVRPSAEDVAERLGIDKTTRILLDQRFEEDLAEIGDFPRTEVF